MIDPEIQASRVCGLVFFLERPELTDQSQHSQDSAPGTEGAGGRGWLLWLREEKWGLGDKVWVSQDQLLLPTAPLAALSWGPLEGRCARGAGVE